MGGTTGSVDFSSFVDSSVFSFFALLGADFDLEKKPLEDLGSAVMAAFSSTLPIGVSDMAEGKAHRGMRAE